MSPLEQLFHLEIEFHRHLRTLAPGTANATSLHTAMPCNPAMRRSSDPSAPSPPRMSNLYANASRLQAMPATCSLPAIQ
jgi:hypothetical protein